MICDVNAALNDKLAAILERTPDQKMEREGVPVSIGGETFEVRPLVRNRARLVRETVKRVFADIEAAGDTVDVLSVTDDAYAAVVNHAIPEIPNLEWLDEHATTEELEDAFQLVWAFINPNASRAQMKAKNGTEPTEDSASPASTPSSASSTPPTPLQPLTPNSQTNN